MVEDKALPNTFFQNLIIFVPLAVVTVFCLSFAQMKAISTQNSMKQEAASTNQNSSSQTLPLITQPTLPKLNTAVETKTPPPVPLMTNTYLDNNQKSEMVGPSSNNSGNALQPNSGNLNRNTNDELQATRKAIRLEDAKL